MNTSCHRYVRAPYEDGGGGDNTLHSDAGAYQVHNGRRGFHHANITQTISTVLFRKAVDAMVPRFQRQSVTPFAARH